MRGLTRRNPPPGQRDLLPASRPANRRAGSFYLGGTGSGAGMGGLGSSGDPGGTGDLGGDGIAGTEAGDLTGTETTAAGGPGDVRDETGDVQRSGPKPDTDPAP